MALLSGPVSITRFNVPPLAAAPDFDAETFGAITPGSEVRESVGFVPIEPDAPWEAGARRWVFRVRIDRLRPDPTAVRERLKQLVASELEATGAPFVGSRKRKELRSLAEEELIVHAVPATTLIECCIDGEVLYVASTAKRDLGKVLEALRRIEVPASHKTPWLDRGDPEVESELIHLREPGESVLGCRFLKSLLGDDEIAFEAELGLVRLVTAATRVSVAGAVLPDVHRYVERGCELLAAKLLTADARFRLEATSFRLASLRVETERHDHWTELLDERLERIAAVFELLETKYAERAQRLIAGDPRLPRQS